MLLLAGVLWTGMAMGQDPIDKVATKLDRSELNVKDSVRPWTILGTATVNINQATFTNWASGGQNSFGAGALFNLKADYRRQKSSWKNTIDLAYGFQLLGKSSAARFTKTDDKVEYTTSYGYALGKHWDVTLLANVRTQFTNGYNYPNDSVAISKFMAPGYVVAGIGINYVPAEFFTLYVSPAAGRFTFVEDDTLSAHGDFGVEKGKRMKGEFGAYVRAVFNKEVFKNVTVNTSVELFSDYLHKFGNVDVNWNVLVGLKVNKWLSTTINTQLIYDDDVRIKTPKGDVPRTQFKEVIGVGLSYAFHQRKQGKRE